MSDTNNVRDMKMTAATKIALTNRLTSVEAEYRRAQAEVDAQPNGNGFASQKEMREASTSIYIPTICGLRRKLGIY